MEEIIYFLIWLDQNYLYEDFDLLTPIGKFFTFLPWLIKNFLILLLTPILYVEYKIVTSKLFNDLKEDYIRQIDEINKMFNNIK